MTSFWDKRSDDRRLTQIPENTTKFERFRNYMQGMQKSRIGLNPVPHVFDAPGGGIAAFTAEAASNLHSRFTERIDLEIFAIYLERSHEVPKGEIGYVCMAELKPNFTWDWRKGFMEPKFGRVYVKTESTSGQIWRGLGDSCYYVDNRVSATMQEAMCLTNEAEKKQIDAMEQTRKDALGKLERERFRQWSMDPWFRLQIIYMLMMIYEDRKALEYNLGPNP